MARCLHNAIQEGRVCVRCGWMITKPNWKKGHRLCYGCREAMRGVDCKGGHHQPQQERIDKTGEML